MNFLKATLLGTFVIGSCYGVFLLQKQSESNNKQEILLLGQATNEALSQFGFGQMVPIQEDSSLSKK